MREQNKKIVSVEILHLDEYGYGPRGMHTRREWRDECLQNLLAGRDQFNQWQSDWSYSAGFAPPQNNELRIHYADGDTVDLVSYSLMLDFCNQKFVQALDVRLNFTIPADFSFATFEKSTDFQGVTFKSDTYFNGASFEDYAVFFNGVTFEKDTIFKSAAFKGLADFNNVTFKGLADFDGVSFLNFADFRQTTFDDISNFRTASFEGKVDFENAEFGNVGHFEGATFNGTKSKIPAFRGCKIDSTRLEFSDDSHFTKNDFTEDAIKNISFLKRLADEHGQTDQALNFNAMELRAKRQLAEKNIYAAKPCECLLFYVFTWLYEKISDFRRSFARPLFCLLGLLFLSFIIGVWSAYLHRPVNFNQSIFTELNAEYLLTKNDGSQTTPLTAFRAASEYSLYRSGNFLDFTDADKNTASINMRLFGSEIEPCWARFFGFFKGIATAVLLFLIALGLRNKYRVS